MCTAGYICLIQCGGWAYFWEHGLQSRGVIGEMKGHSSFCIIKSDLCWVFVRTVAENPVLRKRKKEKTFLFCPVNMDSRFSQAVKTDEVSDSSKFWTSKFLKCYEHCFCKAFKRLMKSFFFSLYWVRHRNGRLLELFFPEPLGWRLEECLRKGGGHLEDVVFKK